MIFRISLLALTAQVMFAAVRITSVEPTVLFPRATPLRQIAIVTLLNDGSETVSCDLTAAFTGDDSGPALAAKAAPGATRVRVLVPDINAPKEVEFTVRAGGQVVTQHKETWQPQRKWKVIVVKSSHEDLGYENYIFKKQHDIAEFIDLGHEMAGTQENVSDLERKSDSRFHYTLETLLFQRNYIDEKGEIAWRKLVNEDLKTGRMQMMGAPSGVHSHWMDYEEIARMTYPGRRETKDRYGLDLKTFMIIDNPSLSWSGAQAVADAGFKYVARWGQCWRTGGNCTYETTKLPPLFWWVAPDQEHRVLFGWRTHYGISFWYGQTGGGYQDLVDLASEHVSATLKKIESGTELGPYPYDAVVNPEYVDHDTPRFDGRVLPTWTQRYAYPDIRIGSPTTFFEYIEAKYGKDLPQLSGDLNNFSADYATIDPESQGWKRRAARVLPMAESIGVLASRQDPSYMLSQAKVDRTYTRFFDYDEHSWPTQPPASSVQLFNAAWVKKREGRRALTESETLWQDASTAFAKNIATGGDGEVAVFNPLAHARDGLLEVSSNIRGLIDSVTGQKVAVQMRGGKAIFVARDVPAMGYKLYRMDAGVAANAKSLSTTPHALSNEFYDIRFDETTGAIRSIVDKTTRRELIDAKAPQLANQMIYVHKETRESSKGTNYSPVRANRQASEIGPVAAEYKVWIDDEKTGAAILQTVTLYEGLKRIDVVNKLDHVRALYSDRYEERYRDNIFYAFPFQVDKGTFHVEYPGGVVRPYDDQLRWGSHDYLFANRWVDISNTAGGVTVAPWNEGTFEFGEIRYNQFSINYKPKTSYLYSYAWSNRMAGLLTLGPEDCNATIGYSINSHDGDWNSGAAAKFGWEVASPLEAIQLPRNQSGSWHEASRGFLSIDVPNVELTVLKPSEQSGRGFVARFAETSGKATEFSFQLAAPAVKRAFLCDLVENDKEPLTVTGDRVKVKIRPFGFATVRFETSEAPLQTLTLQASGVDDNSIRLTWTGSPAVAYNVFRSIDPQDPPTAQTLVARATGSTFIDHGLHHKTHYYYQVAPISAGNLQGAVAIADAETVGRSVTPPAEVDGFGVIRRDKNTLMVHWGTNTEPDVARYQLYRGTTSEFSIAGVKPLATIEPARYFLQLYIDTGLLPGHEYFYKVVAEDFSGNRQTKSPIASAVTPK